MRRNAWIKSMSDTEYLVDTVWDAIAAGRKTIRVGNAKPEKDNATTFFVSFLINIDNKTYEKLHAVADKNERSVPKLLRRYIGLGFRDCFSEDSTDH
jgi:hypothetical protein